MRFRDLGARILLLLAAASSLSAHGAGLLPCATQKVVAFGASVTHATPAFVPLYEGVVNDVENYGRLHGPQGEPAGMPVPARSRPYGLSPVRYLVKAFGGKQALGNVTYRSKAWTNQVDDLGSSQIQRLLHGEDRALFDQASMLVGVDAFYWDAIFGYCDYGRSGRSTRAEGSARELMEVAARSGKILVLGTVPIEVEKNLRISDRRTTVKGMWEPAVPGCVESINRLIRRECRQENNCYVADLFSAAAALNRGERLALRSDGGKSYGLYEMRPDGVHMSDKGTRYISQMILDEMSKRTPVCPAEPPATKASAPEPIGPGVSEFN